MESQVSFRFDGWHNKPYIIEILKQLKGMRYTIEMANKYVFRIYVGAEETDEKVMQVCKGMQCFAVFDRNRVLNAL